VPQLVEVRFKGNRRDFYEWHEPEPLRARDPVIVETDRGVDLGLVGAIGPVAQAKCERCGGCAAAGAAPAARPRGEEEEDAASPLVVAGDGEGVTVAEDAASPGASGGARRVVRRASPADVRLGDELRRGEDDVRRRIRERVTAHKLAMKVSDAEWQWDRKKLTVYFTAEKRVDFRNLVRDLASLFRTRIELRQIGVRDEAVRLDGIGRCGRRLCSASFLTEIRPIGLQIAKDQHLSLNPMQISGPCGRLLCCLRFEHEFYVQARKRFPKEGKPLQTSRGTEKVLSLDIFRETVTLRGEDGTYRTVPLAELRAEVDAAATAPAGTAAPAAPARPAAPERAPHGHRDRTPRHRAAPPPAEAPAPADAAGEPGTPPPNAPRRRRRRRGRRRPPPTP
jgi:cell fate regulator YaaT (PSP1 superfamily)